ncbi:MAG: hypothetical protein IPQ03_07445 [Bacteroidetes bacterium]|nr:hypothetical protein [Bacteroidota bacterium]
MIPVALECLDIIILVVRFGLRSKKWYAISQDRFLAGKTTAVLVAQYK